LYVGIEDVRLFTHPNGDLYYNGNRGYDGAMYVEHGRIMHGSAQSGLLKKSGQQNIEKNWVLFSNSNDGVLKCIYNWHPLTIGNIHGDTYEYQVLCEKSTPSFFKMVRGSTNGVVIGNEIWFLCHVVSYEDRRYYYHMFVVLDYVTMELKKYTRLFTFAKQKVEYCLGFIFRENELWFGYSIMDRETHYAKVSKNYIDSLFVC
jgi:hypothetical protein